ncbi:hypothetical protein ACMFMG_001876 [Clarireedia jacksonii]
MSSDRPFSSWAPGESTPEWSSISVPNKEQTAPRTSYVPHLFDLITPTQRARDLTKQYIPSAYLQTAAVDSSQLIGHGASFTASRQALPSGDPFIEVEVDMGTWSITKRSPAPKRPAYVVYKSARLKLDKNGEPITVQDRRAMLSVLTEFHALLHPPLLNHPNIIDFLGLAWGNSPDELMHKLPVLVVEYADKGTLADLQSRNKQLPEKIKLNLCLGVARGLEVLHENNIIHGDIKPENVLVCSHAEDTYIAKLADFGFAIIEAVEANEVSIGGTRTWRSPESSRLIPKSFLRKTDVYSFGLLAWSLAIDGRNPFDLMVSEELKGEDRLQAIDKLKDDDEVVQAAKFENWILRWQMLGVNSMIPPSFRENFGEAMAVLASPTRFRQTLEKAQKDAPDMGAQLYAMALRLSEVMVKLWQGKLFYKDLEAVLMNTLDRDPSKRSLELAISILQGICDTETSMASMSINHTDAVVRSEDTAAFIVTGQVNGPVNCATGISKNLSSPDQQPRQTSQTSNSSPSSTTRAPEWEKLGFKNRILSWQQMRDLDPSIRKFVAKSFAFADEENRPGLFFSASFYINGYGVEQDFVKGVQLLHRAAAAGHQMSQAYLYRMYTACNIPIPPNTPWKEYLDSSSRSGCRMAMRDLRLVDPETEAYNKKLLRYGYAGTGALWYHPSQMLHGFSQSFLKSAEFSLDSLGTDEEIRDLKVNQRGDYLIHFAAACSSLSLLKNLKEKGVDVNLQNSLGETPLLCACRSGQPIPVSWLIQNGADASIASQTGETPLHWLISFGDNVNIPALGKDLVEKGGADVEAFTNMDISYANIPSGSDLERQIPGTPLMWAVRFDDVRVVEFLLSVGAEPRWCYPGGGTSCLEQAAYLHNAKCLEMMITHLEVKYDTYAPAPGQPGSDKRYVFNYGPLVRNAIHAADRFSMILRNGTQHLENLHATLKYLKEKTVLIKFQVAFNGESPLLLAAQEAHDEVVEWILENKWLPEDINKSGGVSKRTPLLESVRWNRRPMFQMLLKHGADSSALAINPYDEKRRDWSALHIFAHESHDDNLALVDDMIEAGVAIDGSAEHDLETPFNVAVRQQAFALADRLLEFGADINATTTKSSLITSPFPLTGLGHMVALNARYSTPSLRYLLTNYMDAIDFIVEPERELSVLHLAAIVPQGLKTSSGSDINRFDFDWETNRSITHELLEWYTQPDQVNMKSPGLRGKTALHLAVERANVGVVEELIKAGADRNIKSDDGETAGALLKKIWAGSSVGVEMGKLLVR